MTLAQFSDSFQWLSLCFSFFGKRGLYLQILTQLSTVVPVYFKISSHKVISLQLTKINEKKISSHRQSGYVNLYFCTYLTSLKKILSHHFQQSVNSEGFHYSSRVILKLRTIITDVLAFLFKQQKDCFLSISVPSLTAYGE